MKVSTNSNPDFQELLTIIENGMPEERQLMPENLTEFHRLRNDLYAVDGVVIYKGRIIIPPDLREEILESLHAAHQGVTSMIARAESSVFWPGITNQIVEQRKKCYHCNRMAPSLPAIPPFPQRAPEYPFQQVCADYFKYKGTNYLVIVDRYSNWPIIERGQDGADGLITSLRRVFVTYGIAEELSSDGGPEFQSKVTKNFLKSWGVDHCLSSVAFPHSNCRAEIGVKTSKRLITNNTKADGSLDADSFQRNRHMKSAEYWSEHTKRQPPLSVGDQVRIQNQIGSNPLKWDKTGTVIEVRQFDQYAVRVDGSGRVTLRNRKFLRRFEPVYPRRERFSLPFCLLYTSDAADE